MRRIVMVVCAALLFIPTYLKSRIVQESPAHAAFSVLPVGGVLVKVSGSVKHPGIYTLPANSVAGTAIKMAVPLQPLNQHESDSFAATLVRNGSAVRLDVQPDGSSVILVNRMSVAECMVLEIPLDIDKMTGSDFDRLPGIGPGLAKRITEYRQNNGGILRVEDLALVDGIGEKKYKALLSYF